MTNINILNRVVPENIHTPTVGFGNSRGMGWSKAQKVPERGRWGGYQIGSIIPVIMLKFHLFAFSFPSQGKINSIKCIIEMEL